MAWDHFVRLVLVVEDAPEHARPLPRREWVDERDQEQLAATLDEALRPYATRCADAWQAAGPWTRTTIIRS